MPISQSILVWVSRVSENDRTRIGIQAKAIPEWGPNVRRPSAPAYLHPRRARIPPLVRIPTPVPLDRRIHDRGCVGPSQHGFTAAYYVAACALRLEHAGNAPCCMSVSGRAREQPATMRAVAQKLNPVRHWHEENIERACKHGAGDPQGAPGSSRRLREGACATLTVNRILS